MNVRIAIVLVLLLCVFACHREAAIEPNGQSVTVGLIVSGTRPQYPADDEVAMAVRWFFSVYPFLADGTSVDVAVHYDGDSIDGLTSAYTALSKQQNLVVLISFSRSDLLLQASKEGDALAVPIIAAIASNPDVATSSDMISLLSFDDRFQGAIAALFVRDELLIERAAVFSDPSSRYSSYLAQEFASKFQSVGGILSAQVKLESSERLDADLLRTLRAQDTEMLYVTVEADSALEIARQLDAMDWHPRVMVSDGVLANWVENSSDSLHLVQGVLAADLFSPGMRLPSRGKTLRRQFKLADGEFTTSSIMAIDAANLLWQAMSHCASPGRSGCVQKRIRDFDEFDGVLGRMGFTEQGHARRPLIINRIDGDQRRFFARVF